jgi:hypothetical protein
MAVTTFSGGASLASVGDSISPAKTEGGIRIGRVFIEKATAGTVTLKDGSGTVFHITESIGDGAVLRLDFGGWLTNGFEYDAVSAGTAVVRVFYTDAAFRHND